MCFRNFFPLSRIPTTHQQRTHTSPHLTVRANVGCRPVIKGFLCGVAEPQCLTGNTDTHCVELYLLGFGLWQMHSGKALVCFRWKTNTIVCPGALNATFMPVVVQMYASMCCIQVHVLLLYLTSAVFGLCVLMSGF